jgi:hypothetical protein
MGERRKRALRIKFDRKLQLEFQGTKINAERLRVGPSAQRMG